MRWKSLKTPLLFKHCSAVLITDFTYFLGLSFLGFALGVNCSQEVDHGDKSGDDQVGSTVCSVHSAIWFQCSGVFTGGEQQMTGVGQDETPQEVATTTYIYCTV